MSKVNWTATNTFCSYQKALKFTINPTSSKQTVHWHITRKLPLSSLALSFHLSNSFYLNPISPFSLLFSFSFSTHPKMDTPYHHLHSPPQYPPLLPEEQPSDAGPPASHRKPFKGFAAILASAIFLLSLVALIINQTQKPLPSQNNIVPTSKPTSFSNPEPRGVAEGVSAKSNSHLLRNIKGSYNWTNAMFTWQRTSFHFQPEKNWMNGRCNKLRDFMNHVIFLIISLMTSHIWYLR